MARTRSFTALGLVCLLALVAVVQACSEHETSPQATGQQDAARSFDQAAAAPIAAQADVPYPDKNWPLFRGDTLARGVSGSTLPDQLDVVWKVSIEKQSFSATAIVADDVIYVGSILGPFYALNLADGSIKWQREDLDAGFLAAAAYKDGRVYVGDMNGTFHCLNASDGTSVWKYDTLAQIDNGANFYKDKVIFGSEDSYLYCLEAATGNEVWKLQLADQIRCFPSIVDNKTFVAGCDSSLHVVDLDQGKEASAVKINDPTGCTPAVIGDYLYFGSMGQVFFKVNWNKAETAWTYQHAQRKGEYRSSAAATPEIVIVGNQAKMVQALDPATGKAKWTHNTKTGIESSPVIVGQRVYFGGLRGQLMSLDIASGDEVWSYDAGGGFDASPAVAQERLLIGNTDGTFYCFGKQGN